MILSAKLLKIQNQDVSYYDVLFCLKQFLLSLHIHIINNKYSSCKVHIDNVNSYTHTPFIAFPRTIKQIDVKLRKNK